MVLHREAGYGEPPESSVLGQPFHGTDGEPGAGYHVAALQSLQRAAQVSPANDALTNAGVPGEFVPLVAASRRSSAAAKSTRMAKSLPRRAGQLIIAWLGLFARLGG